MSWDATGNKIARKCPSCGGKLTQMECFVYSQGGSYRYDCGNRKCRKLWRTENVFSTKCCGKLKLIGKWRGFEANL